MARWNALVALLFAALASALCLIVHWRYAIFRNDVDLGIFTQVIGGLGHGFSSTAEGSVNHLLVHWSPIVALGWPLLRAWGPLGLEYVQAVLVAAVLFPVWGLARARFSPPTAFVLVAIAALYPILWANGVGDFHEMAFVPLLCAGLVYALDRRRWTLSAVAALLLVCTKEDQFFIVAATGLIFAVTARGDIMGKRAGWGIAGLAIAMSLAYFGVVRPALNPHVPYGSLHFYDWSAAQTAGHDFLSNAVLARVRYVLIVLAPLAFLPCISRYGLFLVVPFVEIFATDWPVTIAPGAHYSALLSGYALAGFVDGAARLTARKPPLARGVIAAAAVVSVWVSIFASPMEYWYYLYRRPTARDALLEATLRQLPAQAQVGAEDEIFAHLALDRNASLDFAGQQWFVYDQTHYSQHWRDVDSAAVRRALARGRYTVRSDRDGIVVLKRSDNDSPKVSPVR
jgi:uncharacterized membrane protein